MISALDEVGIALQEIGENVQDDDAEKDKADAENLMSMYSR